jgi:hypothetical protein
VAAHDHAWRPVSFIPDASRPKVLYGCGADGCAEVDVRCVLCDADGDRRRHATQHDPVRDPVLLDEAAWRLIAAGHEIDRVFGR